MGDDAVKLLHPKSMGQTTPFGAVVVNLRCPVCRHQGAFTGIENIHDTQVTQRVSEKTYLSQRVGIRICPNRDCHAVVFVVLSAGGVLEQCYPPEVLDFDSTNLPSKILGTLEEAIKCYSADCFKATALMVRRLLEELCEDRNATGKDLKAKLGHLGSSVVMPKELLDAADELRLLGNDAAHVEAKDYDTIGKVEAALSLELAKELLKAVFQYGSLLERLRSLKKGAP